MVDCIVYSLNIAGSQFFKFVSHLFIESILIGYLCI